MNLPNKLTLLRIILVPFFVLALLAQMPHHYAVALVIFAVASATDCIDGKIARKRDLVTDFGKFADPLADKILVISALVCFVQLDIISSWPVIIILFREFAVTSVRLVASSKGKVVAANIWGKIKTVSQIIAIILTMILNYALDIIETWGIALNGRFAENLPWLFNSVISSGAIWISAVLAVISGVIYFLDNKKFILER